MQPIEPTLTAIAQLRNPLIVALKQMQLPADDSRIERWLGYLALLEQWNKIYNLSAIRHPAEMLTRHLLDSLAIAPYWIETELADIGSGAGLPGIPLAILYPDRRVILLESNGKKARFLREVKRNLKLDLVEIVEKRAVAFVPDRLISAATARAVGPITELADECRVWLAPGGRLLAMKGPGYQHELADIPTGFALQSVEKLQIPGLAAERFLLILQKSEAL